MENAIDIIRKLNILLGISSGNLDSARQVDESLKFYRNHNHKTDSHVLSIPKVAKNLIKIHLDEEIGFVHFDFNEVSSCPLFTHSAIRQTMRKVKNHQDFLFILSGLKKGICPKGCYYTKKRQLFYKNSIEQIEQLIVKSTPPNIKLRIFFI